MASSRSRASARRSGARGSRSAPQSSSQVPFLVGGAVVLIVVLVLWLGNRGSSPATAGQKDEPPVRTAQPAAAAPPAVQLSGAKAGKAPTTPAPPLGEDTLQKLSSLLDRVKLLRNEAVTARTGAADHALARSKMGEARTLLEEWEEMIEAPLRWQEQAQMEDWAQPAEYMTLERLYATYQRYSNEVRKGGG